MKNNRRKPTYSDTPPYIDYQALADKILTKVASMSYWPINNIAEYMTRMVCKEFSACDVKSPLANDLRIACLQALAEKNSQYASAKSNFASKLKAIHYKHYLAVHTAIR